MWKSCRKNSLRFDLVPEKGDDEVRGGAQVPRRSVHLGRPRRNLGGLNRRGRLSILERSLKQQRTFSPTPNFVLEEARCGILQEMLRAGGRKIAMKSDQTPQKRSTQISSTATSTSIQASPPRWCWKRVQQHVSSTPDDLSQECVRDMYHHRIIFIGV